AGRVERGDLDHPRLDPGGADAVLDLVHVELGDLLRRAHGPIPRDADLLVVEAGRAHDLHARPLRDLGEELGVATEVDRARVDERAHAVVAQLLHALDGAGDARGAVPRPTGGIECVARIADEHVLVDERGPEVVHVDRAENGLHNPHARDHRTTVRAVPAEPPQRAVEVADGVVAIVHGRGETGVSNAGVVHDDGSALVIDTMMFPEMAEGIVAELPRLAALADVVLNTHHHVDHVGGNAVFEDARLVAHPQAADAIAHPAPAAV